MKTILLLSSMILLSCSIYSQNGIEKLKKQSLDLTWKTFKKVNNPIDIKTMDGDVKRVTIDASDIDKDYNKITYIFITNKLTHFIIEFKRNITPESLSKKYGIYFKLSHGYQWVYEEKTIDMLYSNNYTKQLMVSFVSNNIK